MIFIVSVIVLSILYGLYFLITEGKPVKINRFPKKEMEKFNQRYKEGFYNGNK